MSELIVQNQQMVSSETQAVLNMIERVVLNPDADMDKLEKMLDMQERILKRNGEQAFASDFAAMQSELPRIARNGKIEIKDRNTGKITQSTPFAKLEDINDGVRPVLQKYGFGVTFSIDQTQSGITVTARLLHRLGHSERTSLTLPIDVSGSKNNVQGNGSTISYGKRYTLSAILNISTGDDIDGNAPPEDPAPPAQQQKQKELISDHRLAAAVQKIKSGEYSVDALTRNFVLTEAQSKVINTEFAQ